jgi:hypothetical protein
VIAELPTPPPVVISATPVVAEPDAKPPASAERTKTKRRKNDPVPKTTPASTPTNEAPGTNAPKSDPSPSEPHPKPVGPKPPASPRDLKDPFPKK